MASIPSIQAHLQEQHETATVILQGTTKKRRTKKDFTIISNEILRDPTLSKGAKLALIMLISYCWFEKNNCFPGQERLAADLHKSVRTIRRYLSELQEKKHIKIVRRGLGKTNIYYLSLPPNGTKPTDPKQPKMTCPERPKVTAKTDESKHTQVEPNEALSNSSKDMLEVNETDCHIAMEETIRSTEENTRENPEEKSNVANQNTGTHQQTNPSPPNRAERSNTELPRPGERPRRRLLATGMTSTAEVLGKEPGRARQEARLMCQERPNEPPRLAAPPLTQEDMDKRIREKRERERAKQQSPLDSIIPPKHEQILNRQFGTGAQYTTCKSKRQPVYEKLQVAIERISEELGDFKHVTSNITQAENIRRESGADIEQFIVTLYEARAATKHAVTCGKITKQDSTGKLVKMPYFYAVLREKAGLPKAQRTI